MTGNIKKGPKRHKALCLYPCDCTSCDKYRRCLAKTTIRCGYKSVTKYVLWGWLLITEKLYNLRKDKNQNEIR